MNSDWVLVISSATVGMYRDETFYDTEVSKVYKAYLDAKYANKAMDVSLFQLVKVGNSIKVKPFLSSAKGPMNERIVDWDFIDGEPIGI